MRPTEDIYRVLLERIDAQGDFPAMAQAVSKISSLTSSDHASASELAKAILDDYTLTNKVLRVVNSAIYAQSSEITTISRAIVVLGWEAIRSLVLTLKLFDNLPADVDPQIVQSRLGTSFLGAVLARNFAPALPAVNREEAFICGLFHSFGETVVAFFLPEKVVEIRERAERDDKSEAICARRVLGASYADLGQFVARELHFPSLIVNGMNPRPVVRTMRSPTKEEATVGVASLSHKMSAVLLDDHKDTKARVTSLIRTFEGTYGNAHVDVERLIEDSVEELKHHAAVMNLPIAPAKTAEHVLDKMAIGASAHAPNSADIDRVFSDGIGDVTKSLVTSASLSEVLLVVLETMFRGLAFAGVERTAFLVREVSSGALVFRTGLGNNLEDAATWLRVPYEDAGVLRVAIEQQRDVYLSSLDSVQGPALPPSLKISPTEDAFLVVLPIIVNGRPVGTFCIDGRGTAPLEANHLRHLGVLRDQVVLAIRQS